jgi:hypothetical protein
MASHRVWEDDKSFQRMFVAAVLALILCDIALIWTLLNFPLLGSLRWFFPDPGFVSTAVR